MDPRAGAMTGGAEGAVPEAALIGGGGEPVAVRGECPGISKPFFEVDGALIRLTLAGGRLSRTQILGISAALEALSASAARVDSTDRDLGGRDGARDDAPCLEITSRANLQIRGVALPELSGLQRRLLAVMYAVEPDSLRTVMCSPTSGIDPSEIVDVRPLVAELSRRLDRMPSTHPKFGVLIDGGGTVNLRGRRQTLCFGAITGSDGEPWFELTVGEPLPVGPGLAPATLLVRFEDVVEVAVTAAELLAGESSAADSSTPASAASVGRRLRSDLQSAAGGLIVRNADLIVRAGAESSRDVAVSILPIGKLSERPSGQPLSCSVGAMPTMGRVTLGQWASLAELIVSSDAELRLTPWRSVLMSGVVDPDRVIDALDALGFSTDPLDPALGVVACAGSTGCPSATVDTQADGRRLMEALRGGATTGSKVHLSGCSKRCAGKSGHDVSLIGGSDTQGYDVYRRIGDDDLGRLIGRQLDPVAALGLVEKELAGQ